VAKEATTIAEKSGQKKTSVLKKKQTQFTQLLNEASCSNEPDIFVELREEDWYCFICEESSVQDMVQCIVCKKWAHETCAGVDKKRKSFICKLC
jgi:hypothetical protein